MDVPGVQVDIANGLVAATDGCWHALEAEPLQGASRTAIRQALPRVLLASAFAAAAYWVPKSIGVQEATKNSVTVTLGLIAINALAAPRDAIKDTIDRLSAKVK